MEARFRIAVIGLGLIGGSMAYALRGFKNAEIIGCDINPETRKLAIKKKAVDEAVDKTADAIKDADLIILCTYPEYICDIIKDNRENFKAGSVITDVCGIKGQFAEELCKNLPQDVEYVGGHPMAGTENSGFEYASAEMFWMSGFIITPMEGASQKSIDLVYEMAHYIGATRITMASFKEHDSVIAYTSDLMHISASALCLDYNENMNRAYTAGAFRDCTRIAKINPTLWTELFLANRDNVVCEIDRYIGSLTKLRDAIEKNNGKTLKELLGIVAKNKEIMQNKEPEVLKK